MPLLTEMLKKPSFFNWIFFLFIRNLKLKLFQVLTVTGGF